MIGWILRCLLTGVKTSVAGLAGNYASSTAAGRCAMARERYISLS